MKNTDTSLMALNEMLFEQLERVTNDDLSAEDLSKEIIRTKMMTDISVQIVNNAELQLKAIKLNDNLMGEVHFPSVFALPEYKDGQKTS